MRPKSCYYLSSTIPGATNIGSELAAVVVAPVVKPSSRDEGLSKFHNLTFVAEGSRESSFGLD